MTSPSPASDISWDRLLSAIECLDPCDLETLACHIAQLLDQQAPAQCDNQARIPCREWMKRSLAERRRVLAQQADALCGHYEAYFDSLDLHS